MHIKPCGAGAKAGFKQKISITDNDCALIKKQEWITHDKKTFLFIGASEHKQKNGAIRVGNKFLHINFLLY